MDYKKETKLKHAQETPIECAILNITDTSTSILKNISKIDNTVLNRG